MNIDAELAVVMKIDPLATAEDISGQRVEDGGLGFAFGLAMVHSKSEKMRELLTARNDIWDGMPLLDYLRTIEQNGYERLFEIPFEADGRRETLFFYAHRDGLLLKFDTYAGDRVNSGNVYYCWEPSGETDFWITSSGGMIGTDHKIWVGNHDCREALIFNMDRLRAHGRFVTRWPKRPFLWLLHYQDAKVEGYDYEAINTERIAMMPDWVREMIGNDD